MNLVEGIDPSGLRAVSKSLAIYELRDDELAGLTEVARELIAHHDGVESAAFAHDCALAAQELPRSLRSLYSESTKTAGPRADRRRPERGRDGPHAG